MPPDLTTNVPSSHLSNAAVASLILGITTPITLFFGGVFIAPICGIASIIFGIKALQKIKTGMEVGKGIAVAGILLGSLTIIFEIIVIILIVSGPKWL